MNITLNNVQVEIPQTVQNKLFKQSLIRNTVRSVLFYNTNNISYLGEKITKSVIPNSSYEVLNNTALKITIDNTDFNIYNINVWDINNEIYNMIMDQNLLNSMYANAASRGLSITSDDLDNINEISKNSYLLCTIYTVGAIDSNTLIVEI